MNNSRANIEKFLNCCGWPNKTSIACNTSNTTCDVALEGDFADNMKTYGWVFVGLFVVLLALIGFLFYLACGSGDGSEKSDDNNSAQFNTPLTYGW